MMANQAKDPVCGMSVAIEGAKHMSEYEGQTRYFCAAGCKRAFEADPAKYLSPDHKPSM